MTSVNKTFIQFQTHDLQTFPVGPQGPPGLDVLRFGQSFYGVKGWTNNLPWQFALTAGGLGNIAGGVAGTVLLSRLHVPFRCSISQMQFYISSLGTGMVAGQNWMGLYTASGAKVAETADLTTEFSTGSITEVRTVNLTATVRIEAGYYWGAILYRALTASPGMGMTLPTATVTTMTNLNVTGLDGRACIASMGALTLPSQLTTISDVARYTWLAVK